MRLFGETTRLQKNSIGESWKQVLCSAAPPVRRPLLCAVAIKLVAMKIPKLTILILWSAFTAAGFLSAWLIEVKADLSTHPGNPGLVNFRQAGTPTPGPLIRDGSLDPDFTVHAGQAGSGEVHAVTPAPSGSLYIGGSIGAILGVPVKNIGRLLPDGSVDKTFNVGTGPNGIVRRIQIQPDGKVVASGAFTTFNGFARNSIVRLNADGSVDESFSVVSDATLLNVCDIQADMRILVCGDFTTINGAARKQVARLESTGAVDLSFDLGTGLPPGGFIRVITVLSDGKMFVGGNFSSVSGTAREGIARLNSDGSVDTTYTYGISVSFVIDIQVDATGKVVVTGFNNGDRVFRALPNGSLDPLFNSDNAFQSTARFATPLPDGKILVGGAFSTVRVGTTTIQSRCLVRLNEDGTIDQSFTSPMSSPADVYNAHVDGSSKITVGGLFTRVEGASITALVRLNADGSVDPGFMGRIVNRSIIFTTLLEPDGKIMLGGGFDTLNASGRNRVGRIHADGLVDETFNPDPSVNSVTIDAIVRQPDGKYLVGGVASIGNNLALWRLNSDGSLDTSFTPPTFGSNSFVFAIGLQPDGKVLIGGSFTTVNGQARKSFARLDSNGSVDSLVVQFDSTLARIEAVQVLPDGGVIIGGAFEGVNGASGIRHIARIGIDGSVDQQFSLNHGGTFSQIRSLTEINGSVYVGGNLSLTGVNDSRFPVVKMSYNGVVDLAFNAGNLVGSVYSVSALPYGKLLIGGSFVVAGESGNRRSIARILKNGAPDYTFDAGEIVGNNGAVSEIVYGVATLPNSRVFVAGVFNAFGSETRWGTARLIVDRNVTRVISDFDGDARTDISLFRPSESVWYWRRSHNRDTRAISWGAATDKLSPADFDSDGRTDFGVFRPAEGRWYILEGSRFTVTSSQFGIAEDIPTPGDFDGDGHADIAVFRPSTGAWWINRTTEGLLSVRFGQPGDVPVAADYDGDGRNEIAIFRPGNGQWWILKSSDGQVMVAEFGANGDKPVQGDYTGDRRADIALWRPSTGEWFILRSEDSTYYSAAFGLSTDIPAPGEYDGDGKYDLTVFRPSTGTWYSQQTTAGTVVDRFGKEGDRPIPNAFVP